MKVRIFPSVLATCWRDDFQQLGTPKQVLFQYLHKYTNHIGIYDKTIKDIAKLANSNNKENKIKAGQSTI